ncbi:hypothetical protein [uncultured Gemmiger sp.]|nr:hypothetical protein [uncultured Gemmiger sp.]
MTGILNPQCGDLCLYWDSAYTPVDTIPLTKENGASLGPVIDR